MRHSARPDPELPRKHGPGQRLVWSMEEGDGDRDPEPVSAEILSEIESDLGVPTALSTGTAEDRTARRNADRRIVEILATEGFEGDRFDLLFRKLSARLIEYSWPIMSAWFLNGRIFELSKPYGKLAPPPGRPLPRGGRRPPNARDSECCCGLLP
jgi:hypothetical protein